ncbi:MAG: glycosyltransferase [bacterium]
MTITHNRANHIAWAIASVRSQSLTDWELIIIDDASTDDTKAVVQEFLNQDQRIRYIKNEKNLGISNSRNLALEKARGQFIAVLDSDDIWCYNEKLQKQYDFLSQNPEYVLVGGGVIQIDEQGVERKRYLNPCKDSTIRKKFLAKNPFAHSSVMYSRNLALELGGYKKELGIGEDYDLWLRMGKKGKLANLNDYLLKYRIHSDGTCFKDLIKALKNNIKIIKKYRKDYPNYFFAFLRRWSRLLVGYIFLRK